MFKIVYQEMLNYIHNILGQHKDTFEKKKGL